VEDLFFLFFFLFFPSLFFANSSFLRLAPNKPFSSSPLKESEKISRESQGQSRKQKKKEKKKKKKKKEKRTKKKKN
jgi:hypothetical protein